MYHDSSNVVARGFLTVEQLTELGSMTTASVFITTSPLPAAQLHSPRTGRGKHMKKVTEAVTNLREVWRKRRQGGLGTTPGSDDWGILRIARITGSTVSDQCTKRNTTQVAAKTGVWYHEGPSLTEKNANRDPAPTKSCPVVCGGAPKSSPELPSKFQRT